MTAPSDPAGGYDPAEIEARVAQLMDLARAAGYPLRPWTVRHDLRGQAAGEARLDSGELRFNPVLGAENRAHFVAHVVAHEVAHLLAYWHGGRGAGGHGAPWRAAMALLGSPPERCHRYDTGNARVRRQRRWAYRCRCPEPHLLSTTRHYRVQRGEWRYACRVCGERLAFESEIADAPELHNQIA